MTFSISMTAWFAPPWSGPQSALTPAEIEAPYRGLFPSPPLFDRMPTYRTQGKRSLNFLSACLSLVFFRQNMSPPIDGERSSSHSA